MALGKGFRLHAAVSGLYQGFAGDCENVFRRRACCLFFKSAIVGLADGKVAFRVRDAGAANRRRTVELPAIEFIGRFLSHVLPAGFKRIRHYGLLASRHKTQKLAACRALFDLPPPDPLVIESVAAFMSRVAQLDVSRCPCCGIGHLLPCGAIAPVRRPFAPRLTTGPPIP